MINEQHLTGCRSRYHSDASGFTYLWVMFTVAILGMGLLTAATLYSLSLRRDKEKELLFIGHQFRNAIRLYAVNHGQQYPASLDVLLKDPEYPGIRRYLRRIYVDPMTGRAEWGLIRVAGRIVGVYSLSHAAPFKVDNFDLVDAGFKDQTQYSQWTFTYPWNLVIPDDGSPIKGLQTTNLAGLGASSALAASAVQPASMSSTLFSGAGTVAGGTSNSSMSDSFSSGAWK